MSEDRAYALAHARVKTLHGPARNHPCEFCGLRGHDWALDWEAPEIIRDNRGLAYSPNPDFYMPMCRPCHRAYDGHVAKFSADAPAVLRLRDRLWKAVDPELRAAQRTALTNSFTAVQMWLKNADDVVDRRVRTFDLAPEPVAESASDWFTACFTRDAESVILGADAFTAYAGWCDSVNLPVPQRLTRRAFFASMEKRGSTRKRIARGIALVGVKLATN